MNYIQNIISKITLALMGEGRGVGLLVMCICVFLPQMAQADELPDVVIGQQAVSSLQNKIYVFKNKVAGVWLTVTNDGKLSVTDTQPVTGSYSTYRSQYFTVTDGGINYSLVDANDPSSGITISNETAEREFVKRRKTEAVQPTVRILDTNNRYVMYKDGKLVSITTSSTLPNTEWYAYEVTPSEHNYNDDGICKYCDALQPLTPVYNKADGNTVDYYEIGSAAQLWLFARMVNNGQTKINGKLTKDIDMSAICHAASEGVAQVNWTPIGNSGKKYAGTFDGDNHTISNLYFNSSTTSYIGLFGYTSGATIQKVGVVDAIITGYYYVGGVCGYNKESSITNCYAKGTVSGVDDVGGVCGYNDTNSTITNCYATGTVSGDWYVGGVCGYNFNNSTITNCYATGTVSGTYSNIGGVCGYNKESSTITNCYATATVSGVDNVGGVCGYNKNSAITNCYTTQAKAIGYNNNSTETRVEGGVTLKRFQSGEIAWKLNGTVDSNGTWTAGPIDGSQAWYQNLLMNGDDSPRLSGKTVYYDAARTPAYYNLVEKGDLNADGNITIADLTLLVEILNGRATDTNDAADVDGNGTVNVNDVEALRNIALNGEHTFTVTFPSADCWSSANDISINGVTYKYQSGEGTTTAVFVPKTEGEEAEANASGKFCVIYPASKAKLDDGKLKFNISQDWSGALTDIPLYAESGSRAITLNHKFAIVAVSMDDSGREELNNTSCQFSIDIPISENDYSFCTPFGIFDPNDLQNKMATDFKEQNLYINWNGVGTIYFPIVPGTYSCVEIDIYDYRYLMEHNTISGLSVSAGQVFSHTTTVGLCETEDTGESEDTEEAEETEETEPTDETEDTGEPEDTEDTEGKVDPDD